VSLDVRQDVTLTVVSVAMISNTSAFPLSPLVRTVRGAWS